MVRRIAARVRPSVDAGRRRMPVGAPLRGALRAPGFVVLALLGAWVAHTLEYLRVWGTNGLEARLSAPLHLWMLPLGGALLALAAAGGMRWVRLHHALSARLDAARAGLTRRLRNLPAPPAPRPQRTHAVPAGTRAAGRAPAPLASLPARLAALWLSLSACIVVIYLVQENVEAAAALLPSPGLAPVTGLHAAATLIVAAVAFLLAACVVEVRRRTAAVACDAGAVERLLAALEGMRRQVAAAPVDRGLPNAIGLERLGAQLWRRPPPVLAPAR